MRPGKCLTELGSSGIQATLVRGGKKFSNFNYFGYDVKYLLTESEDHSSEVLTIRASFASQRIPCCLLVFHTGANDEPPYVGCTYAKCYPLTSDTLTKKFDSWFDEGESYSFAVVLAYESDLEKHVDVWNSDETQRLEDINQANIERSYGEE